MIIVAAGVLRRAIVVMGGVRITGIRCIGMAHRALMFSTVVNQMSAKIAICANFNRRYPTEASGTLALCVAGPMAVRTNNIRSFIP